MGISALILGMLACSFLPSTSLPPDDTAIETFTAATLNAQATLLPTETPALSAAETKDDLFPIVTLTSIIPPPSTPSEALIFRDDFDGVLKNDWTWVREDNQLWSLTERTGSLRIYLDPANCSEAPANIPLIPPPQGDYLVETQVDFTPTDNFQMAGLIVYQDDMNYLKLGRAYCNLEGNCVGDGIYFDKLVADNFSGPNFATKVAGLPGAYLRLQFQKGSFTGYFSDNGENWSKIGEHSSEIIPKGIGLYTGQSCDNSPTADFEYFTVSRTP